MSIKNLFDTSLAHQIKQRIGNLYTNRERQWGTMTAAQTLAHCALGLEMALGDIQPQRGGLMERMIGRAIKHNVLGDDEPFRRNANTIKELVVRDARNFETERIRLYSLIDRFVSGGPSVCTTHPHPFFGALTPAEWAILMYKHLDYHLCQFGV